MNTIRMTALVILAIVAAEAGSARGIKQAVWQNPLPLGSDLYDVFFIDTLTGWCVGAKGAVLSTHDGGSTWTIQQSNTDQDLFAVQFVDRENGWAGGSGTILGTTDGGNHWAVQRNNLDAVIRSIHFLDGLHGWGCGDSVVIGTSNGGNSWTRTAFDTTITLRSIAFLDVSTGWVAGNNGFFKTTDGGATWAELSIQDSSAHMRFSKLTFVNQHTGWLTGTKILFFGLNSIHIAGYIWKTTDGGGTWDRQYADSLWFDFFYPHDYFTDFVFTDSLYGFFNSVCQSFVSTDGGTHWSAKGSAPGPRFTMPDRRTLYSVGARGSIAKSADLATSWQGLSRGTLDDVNKIQFFDTVRGIAAASLPYEGSVFLRTSDGGNNWISTTNFFNQRKIAITGCSFVDSMHGWVSTWSSSNAGLVFATTDGGSSWIQQTDSTSYTRLFGIHFSDSQNGLAVGSGVILRTADGGATWFEQFHGFGGTPEFYAAFLRDSLTGWAGGLDRLYSTTDGGRTWQERDTLAGMPYYSINALVFSTYPVGWAAGYDWSLQTGFVARSSDGGNTWLKVLTSNGNYTGLQAFDALRGYAVGNGGTLASTTDGGESWDVNSLPHINKNLRSVFFADGNHGWVAGESGAILRLIVDATTTEIGYTPPSIPPGFELAQNYPNPFNPHTMIRYVLPGREHVMLKVFNILGSEVATLVNEVQEPGEKLIEFQQQNLPTGVYFYRLSVADRVETRKMILCK